jgi:hypothetical protein
MARPSLPDRGAVADANLSVRLTSQERARWDAFVARQSAALRGTGARVTGASLARDVLVARLDAEGIPTDPAELAAFASSTPPTQTAFWPTSTAGATAGATTTPPATQGGATTGPTTGATTAPAAAPPPAPPPPAPPPPAAAPPPPPPPAPAPAPAAARPAKPAKKAPAKKTSAKKTSAKKTSAKKTSAKPRR